MNKFQLLLFCLFNCLSSKGQLLIGSSIGYNQSTLYNKSDKAADDRLNYKATLRTSGGFIVGYQISPKAAFLFGFQYLQAGQNFVGTPINDDDIKNFDASIKLNYLHLPIGMQLNVGNINSTLRQHIVIGGYYSSLLSFTDVQNAYYSPKNRYFGFTSLETMYNANNTINVVEQYSKSDGSDSISVGRTYNLSGSVFSKQDYGVQIGYGVSLALNSRSKLYFDANLKYGFAQVDNLDTLDYMNDIDPSLNSRYSIKEAYICRNNFGQALPTDNLRNPKSNNIFIGLQLSFVYSLQRKIKNKK